MKAIGKSILAALLLVAVATTAYAQQYPSATGYVNDFAQLLTREQGISLNDELVAFEKKTTIEVAVVIVPWLNNQSIENYTRGLAKEWGVGKRGQNNGVVFLIAPKERKMRIEIASGIHSILTDSRADQIRDQVILPRFKTGDMAQGIIDGTHAIMRTLDASPLPSAPQSGTSKWTTRWSDESVEILKYLLGSIAGILVLLFLMMPLISRSKARKYVLENKRVLATRFAEAKKMARDTDVKEETYENFAKLKGKFSAIDLLTVTSERVDWIVTREKLDSIRRSLNNIDSDMRHEIAFAEKARREGPELMKKIPDMIEAAEKKLAEGKPSPKAVKYLEKARSQYLQVQSQQSGITMTDWVILYLILTNIESDTAKAESAHEYSNTGEFSRDSGSSYGFGDDESTGFGGGEFDSSSGSSGTW